MLPAGWFTQPSPFFDGPLSEEEAEGPLNAALEALFEELALLPPVSTGQRAARTYVHCVLAVVCHLGCMLTGYLRWQGT